MANPFVWTDLSAHDLPAAKAFYAALFGWSYFQTEMDDGMVYHIAHRGLSQAAGLFEMPEAMRAKGLPPFWMPYIRVESVVGAVSQAQRIEGARIEVPPTRIMPDTTIALIRDPAGAGFTVYQGPPLDNTGRAEGHFIWPLYHTDDPRAVAPFYANLFGWNQRDLGAGVFEIRLVDEFVIARAEAIPEAVRGRSHYWMPAFGVRSVADGVVRAQDLGAECLADMPPLRAMVQDPQGAVFIKKRSEQCRCRAFTPMPARTGARFWPMPRTGWGWSLKTPHIPPSTPFCRSSAAA